MATATPASSSGRSVYHNISDNHKRWMVFGIALNHVLVPNVLPFVDQEVQKEYVILKTSHNIHTQSSHSRLKNWPKFLKYENINSNDTLPKLRGGKCDYSSFDCKVTSHVDFAKLYLDNHMAKFNAFDDTCDASAVLTLLGKVPVFSTAVQSAAYDVRQARNSWAHCLFSDWDEAGFQKIFLNLKQLVNVVGISNVGLLNDLDDWEKKGIQLCMNATADPDLVKLVQEHVNLLKNNVSKIAFEKEEKEENRKKIENALVNRLDELDERVATLETEFLSELSSTFPEISYEFANCETDIKYLTERYDPDTRQWLIEHFDQWFKDPGDSRAYVLLGDAAVGKSVMAAVLAQRAKKDGYLAAAYFCRHNDGTRNNPRYLLGTIAHEMCNSNAQYSKLVGGESGIQSMLANSKANINELFTKLLEEPLGRCDHACKDRELVVIDALDEAEYSSRDDFLDLIMHRFPLLPKWLVFFITSRHEDTVQFRLQTYNPCIRICAGNNETPMFYQQHEQDIRRFLEKKVNFSTSPFSLEDITKKCNGMFLYAFYIVEMLKNPSKCAKIGQIADIFPENINEFFRKNFKRIFDKVGTKFYDKLFGCALVAPAPLPLSFISFLLKKENSNLDKQEVIDAVSQFVVLRTPDQTFSFLHNLIPAWLTDEQKSSRRLFVDRNNATQYFRTIVVELLSDCINEQSELFPSSNRDLLNYVLRFGVRFLCGYNAADYLDIVYSCLTSYQFIEKRIKMSKIEIYSFIKDIMLFLCTKTLDDEKKEILQELSSVLEGEIHVLSLNPTLLQSCLGNASKLVQTSVTIPVRGAFITFMELKRPAAHAFCDFRDNLKYFAFSPDKTLLAGTNGNCITLLKACSFEKVFGPFEVEEHASISHLEFSPDGNFVFFGRLDRWLSVQRRCVEEFSHFSGNSTWYQWGSFILNGRYIVVREKRERHTLDCLRKIFKKWLNEVDGENYKISILLVLERLGNLASRRQQGGNKCECDHRVTPIWRHIIEIYADLFTFQIWNVDSGSPALIDLSMTFPFLYYLCDELNKASVSRSSSQEPSLFADAAFANSILRTLTGPEEKDRLIVYQDIGFDPHPFQKLPHDNPEWFASSYSHTVNLYKRIEQGVYHVSDSLYSINDVKISFFESDNSAFFYLLQDGSFCSLSLQTGTKHVSASGLYPLYLPPKGEVGFVFRGDSGENILLAKDLPREFLTFMFSATSPLKVKVAFKSNKNIVLVSCRGMMTSFKKEDGDDCLEFDTARLLTNCFLEENFHTKNCMFSEDGKIFAAQQGSELLLFENGKFLFSKKVPFLSFSCFTLSPDGSFLLFCVQASHDTHFYMVDVCKQIISKFKSLLTGIMTVECCCFSPDNTKLILCGNFLVEVWQYPFCSNMPIQSYQTFSPHNQLNTFSYCSVSSNSKWLACCITNRIQIFKLDTLTELRQVPHGHSARVQYCRFLKGDSYLISYGLDNIAFLFDLSEWKTISYVRVAYEKEYILSMAVSPNEDNVVCLTSSGRLNLIKLSGLLENKALKFPLMTSSKSHRKLTDPWTLPPRPDPLAMPMEEAMTEQHSPKLEVTTEMINEITMIQQMNEFLPSDTDSDDDNEGSVEEMEVE